MRVREPRRRGSSELWAVSGQGSGPLVGSFWAAWPIEEGMWSECYFFIFSIHIHVYDYIYLILF